VVCPLTRCGVDGDSPPTGTLAGVRHVEQVEAVLLDMDGTLVDSDAAVERAWAAWAGEYGVDPAAALANVHNGPAERTVARLLPHADATLAAAAAKRNLALQYDDLGDVVASPGAPALIAALGQWHLPWAVVTSADRRLAEARLRVAEIEAPVLVTADDVASGKPDPEGYLLAARRLGVEPSRCLVVEDSEPGLAAGRAAGAMTATLRGLRGDVSLRHLTELVAVLAEANSRRDR
jgi:sugar-phosphatase